MIGLEINILPDDLKKKGQVFFLYCVENSLRLFIDATLRQQYGANYFEKIQTNKP